MKLLVLLSSFVSVRSLFSVPFWRTRFIYRRSFPKLLKLQFLFKNYIQLLLCISQLLVFQNMGYKSKKRKHSLDAKQHKTVKMKHAKSSARKVSKNTPHSRWSSLINWYEVCFHQCLLMGCTALTQVGLSFTGWQRETAAKSKAQEDNFKWWQEGSAGHNQWTRERGSSAAVLWTRVRTCSTYQL